MRLHLAGFFWEDCSLSNTLFRRDAGALAAYLVDAETGELRATLSNGQRAHDLEIAEKNLAGELLDLAGVARPCCRAAIPLETAESRALREALGRADARGGIGDDERWRIDERLRG